jgi:hypothetical protein
MTYFSIAIQKESDGPETEYVGAVLAHRLESGLPDSVYLELRFRTAEELSKWVREAADAWL